MSDEKTGRIKRSRGSLSDSSATSPFSNTTKPASKMQKSATSQGPHNATTTHTTAVSGTESIKDDIKSLRKLVVDIQKEQRAINVSIHDKIDSVAEDMKKNIENEVKSIREYVDMSLASENDILGQLHQRIRGLETTQREQEPCIRHNLERAWRRSRTHLDRSRYKQQCHLCNRMMTNAKSKYLADVIAENSGSLRDREVACSASDRQGSNFESCVWRTVSSQSSHHPQEVLLAQFSLYVHKGGLKPDSFLFAENSDNPRRLWNLINNILHRIPPPALPEFTSVKSLCDHFSRYFVDKIETIHSKFPDKVQNIPQVQKPEIRSKMNVFERASEDEIKKLILSASSKSCDLDPIPTSMLKNCFDILITPITHIINISMETSTFP